MSSIDHLFVFLFAIVHPVAGYISFRRLMKRIDAGMPTHRNLLYRNTIIGHWSLFTIAILVWSRSDRPWAEMGVGWGFDLGFLLAAILALSTIGFFITQTVQVIRADQQTIDNLGRKLGRLEPLLPQNGGELARFYAVSVSAGIVEEILWRGFMIWYLTQFMPLWAAASISALGFGLAHAYQGGRQVPRIAIVGALFVVLYLLSGTIWLPVLVHAAIDVLQGRLAFEITHRRNAHDSDNQAVSS